MRPIFSSSLCWSFSPRGLRAHPLCSTLIYIVHDFLALTDKASCWVTLSGSLAIFPFKGMLHGGTPIPAAVRLNGNGRSPTGLDYELNFNVICTPLAPLFPFARPISLVKSVRRALVSVPGSSPQSLSTHVNYLVRPCDDGPTVTARFPPLALI